MKPRVLHAITVYNGRAFVSRAIESAVQIDQTEAAVDVLVLDDASPEPGFSSEIARFCSQTGAFYYRTPRNLGIPRNVSLGMLAGVKKGYDFVTINNSDVIFPKNLINSLVSACRTDPKIGSVTAWSNNVSIFSLPNGDPDKHLASQTTVDFISDCFSEKFGTEVLDTPAGISFCILMPVDVIKKVGLMDPVFGRGYCEETDWSLRSLELGYRVCLGLGAFVYHQGRGSNLSAGLVSGAHTSVPENEAIIDLRYPKFRDQCNKFESAGVMAAKKVLAVDCLLDRAAAQLGYCIVPGWQKDNQTLGQERLRVEMAPDGGAPVMRYSYAGFEQRFPLKGTASLNEAIARFGRANLKFNAFQGLTDNTAAMPYPVPVW